MKRKRQNTDKVIKIGKNKIWNLTTFYNNIIIPVSYILLIPLTFILIYMLMLIGSVR